MSTVARKFLMVQTTDGRFNLMMEVGCSRTMTRQLDPALGSEIMTEVQDVVIRHCLKAGFIEVGNILQRRPR